jgi:hypothetical protein
MNTLFNNRKWLVALSGSISAGVFFALAYHWHLERWVIVLASLAAAICLALAIDRHSLAWHGLGILTLFLSSVRCWRHGDILWAIVSAGAAIFGLVQFFRRLQSSGQFEGAQEWPLTKGEWVRSYVQDDARVICYQYQANGSYYSGTQAAGSPFSSELASRLDALKGKPAFIRYKPEHPEISTILKSDQPELPA